MKIADDFGEIARRVAQLAPPTETEVAAAVDPAKQLVTIDVTIRALPYEEILKSLQLRFCETFGVTPAELEASEPHRKLLEVFAASLCQLHQESVRLYETLLLRPVNIDTLVK